MLCSESEHSVTTVIQFSVLVTSSLHLQLYSVKLHVMLVPSTRISIRCVVTWMKNTVIFP